MKKPIVIAIVVILVAAAGGAYWWAQRSQGDANSLTLHGNVDIRQVSLAFDGNGRVEQMRVDEGAQVKAGDVLATLDTRTLALQAQQAQHQIDVQKQTLLGLKNGSRPEEIVQAKSRLASAQAQAEQSRQDLARLQGISAKTDGRGVSNQDMDRARSNLKVAAAQAEVQREALRLAQLGPRTEDVARAQAQLEASQSQLDLLNHQIELGTLKAPSDAVVRSRLLEPGDMATPQKPAYALALTQPKWVRVYVQETELGKVKPGMAANVYVDSDPGQAIGGKVGYISSVAEFTPKSVQTEELRTRLVYEVRVLVDDPQDHLRLGQPATVRLALQGAQ